MMMSQRNHSKYIHFAIKHTVTDCHCMKKGPKTMFEQPVCMSACPRALIVKQSLFQILNSSGFVICVSREGPENIIWVCRLI